MIQRRTIRYPGPSGLGYYFADHLIATLKFLAKKN
jgi:hypothetical protein